MWSREAQGTKLQAITRERSSAGAGSELSGAETWTIKEERQQLVLGGAGSLSIGKTALNREELPLPK